jgi:hypothetical protein
VKDREAAVTLAAWPHDHAAMLGHDDLDEHVMARQGGPHCLGMLLPEGGATFDVGEEEGNGAGWQAGHR